MAKTIRTIIKRKQHIKWMRCPKCKHKMLAGESHKQIVTDWSDKQIAALKEMKHKLPK